MSDDLFEDFFVEADALASVDTETTKSLSEMVRRLRSTEDEIARVEQYIKELTDRKHKLSTESIPVLMDEMGVERVDVDGVTVTRKMVVAASIPVARREEAFDWLRQNNLDDIIKNDVVVSFGKGEDNVAGDVIGFLQEQGFDPQTKTYVHPSTLKAFVKERIQSGKPIDLDMFGAFVSNVAEIKRKS